MLIFPIGPDQPHLFVTCLWGWVTTFFAANLYVTPDSLSYTLQSWRWRQNIPSKHWYLPITLHAVNPENHNLNNYIHGNLKTYINMLFLKTSHVSTHSTFNVITSNLRAGWVVVQAQIIKQNCDHKLRWNLKWYLSDVFWITRYSLKTKNWYSILRNSLS